MAKLIKTPISIPQAKELIVKVFEISPDGDKCRHIVHLFDGEQIGAELPTVRGNAWALLNAVTEHVDYAAGKTQDTRLKSAWFGGGEQAKQRMMEELLKLAA